MGMLLWVAGSREQKSTQALREGWQGTRKVGSTSKCFKS